jgi:beta-galactosidase
MTVLHGGDYNPDQWLTSTDVLADDIRLMGLANINVVSLGIFAWAALEPEDGVYRFDWLRNVIDSLYASGISTILATPSGARPAWLAAKYPEVLRVSSSLTRNKMGGRHNHCLTSPVYREKVYEINRRLSEAFGGHPGVILWHLSNEYSGECFCPLCQSAFRDWLKQKYVSLDALNGAWWTAFWSHTYTAWEQIEPPLPNGENDTHGLRLDWKRFVNDQTVGFCKHERDAVRAGGSKLPVTTNLMGFFDGLNYFKFADVLDVVSWDSYPEWGRPDKPAARRAAETACAHDLMRGIMRKPFLLMESTPSVTNWNGAARLKRPGVHMLSSMQAIAHGSDSVQYFQWRKGRGSCEKLHGAVVDHYGGEDTRVFRDVAELGMRLSGLDAIAGTRIKPQAAIIYDWENRWAIENARGPRNIGMHYVETILDHYEAFWRAGIPADIQDMSCDFTGYKLVVAPMLYMYRERIADKLRAFVKDGGTLVGTYWSGVVDENDLCFLGGVPGGLTDVFGLRVEEIDALWDGETNELVSPDGASFKLRELCERVVPQGAETLARYGRDFYKGEPALLYNEYGSGCAYYIAARPEQAFYRGFYDGVCKRAGIKGCIAAVLPDGVTASQREDANGGRIIFLQNFNEEAVSVTLKEKYADLETGEVYEGGVTLNGYEVKVLRYSL